MRLSRFARASLIDARSRRQADASAAIQVENHVDRPPADGAKRDVVAREHDAVGLRPIVAAGLIVGAFERTDAVGVPAAPEQARVVLLLLTEQRVHLAFRPVRGAN